jgi:hypothetical protein
VCLATLQRLDSVRSHSNDGGLLLTYAGFDQQSYGRWTLVGRRPYAAECLVELFVVLRRHPA